MLSTYSADGPESHLSGKVINTLLDAYYLGKMNNSSDTNLLHVIIVA
jgi:hypothetical protein